jgi:exodeoxyribonuclease V alpha subunit
MPVFDAPKPLLNRCLLYTAVTRAKELFIFVGKSDIIGAMVENGRANVSYCGLKYLLKRRAEK